jgi:hypothetical protein
MTTTPKPDDPRPTPHIDGRPIANTLPAGVTVDALSLEWAPTVVTLRSSITWDDTRPEQDCDDCVFDIDNHFAGSNRGRTADGITSFALTKAGNTRSWAIRLDNAHFQFAEGYHEVGVNWLALHTKAPAGEARFACDPANPDPLPPQQPAPAVRLGKVVRAMFHLDTQQFTLFGRTDLQAIKDAGVNALTIGAFQNPVYGRGQLWSPQWEAAVLACTEEQWEATWRPWLTQQLEFCRNNGIGAVSNLNDFWRTGAEVWWYNHPGVTWRPSAERKVRDLLAQYRDVVHYCWIDDEADFNPNLHAVDVEAFYSMWHENPDAPPLSAPGQHPVHFEVPTRTDFDSRFSRLAGAEYQALLDGGGLCISLPQVMRSYEGMLQDLPPGFTRARVMQLGVMRGDYWKRSPGEDYNPEFDQLVKYALPEHYPARLWGLLLVTQCRGVVAYTFDSWQIKQLRKSTPIGHTNEPVPWALDTGTEHWRWFAAAMQSLAARESLILAGTPIPYEFSDSWVIGGWENGLEVWVNCAPFARPVPGFEGAGVLLTDREYPYLGGLVPPGGVVLER